MTREERFLKVLAELGGSAGNGKLQAELGWQDATYARAQEILVENGLTDGRVEVDNNIVDTTIRAISRSRKNALFAGSAVGGEN